MDDDESRNSLASILSPHRPNDLDQAIFEISEDDEEEPSKVVIHKRKQLARKVRKETKENDKKEEEEEDEDESDTTLNFVDCSSTSVNIADKASKNSNAANSTAVEKVNPEIVIEDIDRHNVESLANNRRSLGEEEINERKRLIKLIKGYQNLNLVDKKSKIFLAFKKFHKKKKLSSSIIKIHLKVNFKEYGDSQLDVIVSLYEKLFSLNEENQNLKNQINESKETENSPKKLTSTELGSEEAEPEAEPEASITALNIELLKQEALETTTNRSLRNRKPINYRV